MDPVSAEIEANKLLPRTRPKYGMRCPMCESSNTYRTDSRSGTTKKGDYCMIRRYECRACKKAGTACRWANEEILRISTDIIIVKRNGTHAEFEIEKIKRSIRNACFNRPVQEDRIARIAKSILFLIDATSQRKKHTVVSYSQIGKLVLDSLKELDHVAYLRYASRFYRFTCIQDYLSAITYLGKLNEESNTNNS